MFALRPAPVIVNWFGFPGTMGTPDHHYLIADDRIIPPDSELYYTEKVVRLSCYQPNDRKRIVAAAAARAEEGLPDDAFVFCCLNGPQKFTPPMFATLDGDPRRRAGQRAVAARRRRRHQRAARATSPRRAGVAPERLIFAEKKANPDHLARYALADLFLDTFPYGAHTTAADALWMGVPVVDHAGRASPRGSARSLVHAAGIGELVCADHEATSRARSSSAAIRQTISALKARD